MKSHKKKLVSASLLFVGILSFTTLKADAVATNQDVQNLRYCTINNIYKTPRAKCPLRQDHILNRLDEDGTTRPQNGKQDGTGSRRANRPRIADCPNYAAKQTQATSDPATEPTATANNTQPQDGTGNQYGQQNNYDSAQETTSMNQQTTQSQQVQQPAQQQETQQQPVQQQQVRQHREYTNQTSQNNVPVQQQNRVHHNNIQPQTGSHHGRHH